MNSIKHIRCQLGLTQKALALGIGCTQGNVWHYEMGQSVPPPAAAKLIAFAATRGLVLTYDDIYANQDASAVTTPAAVRVAAQAVVPAAA